MKFIKEFILSQFMIIKQIALEQRPRERMKAGNSLSDADLLALLLGSGVKWIGQA